jgi:hypothetical protein
MSVSTLNPHLVRSVSLHDVCRRALDDMHSRSAGFRVEGQYYSAEVFSPFITVMMCAAARVLGLGFDLLDADDEHPLLDLFP